MKFKSFLLIYLGLIYCDCADLELTVENVIMPTKLVKRYVDMEMYLKLVVNDSAPLNMTFIFSARNNLKEKKKTFYFNDQEIIFGQRTDIVDKGEMVIKAAKHFTIEFPKPSEKHIGRYTLKILATNDEETIATGSLFSPPILQEFPTSRRQVEGGRLETTCKFTSYPYITHLKWSSITHGKHNFREMESTNTSKFKEVIIWDLLIRNDSGYYKCFATNSYGNDTVILQLRVKDKLAPLWPFLGILIEILILVIIIVVYERQKSKKKALEVEKNPLRQSLLESKKNEESEELRQRHVVT